MQKGALRIEWAAVLTVLLLCGVFHSYSLAEVRIIQGLSELEVGNAPGVADCCFPCMNACVKCVSEEYCRKSGGKVVSKCSGYCEAEDCPESQKVDEFYSPCTGSIPLRRKKPKEKPIEFVHPETGGVMSLQEFLTEAALGYKKSLAKQIWESPAQALRKAQYQAKRAGRRRDRKAQMEALTELGHVCYLLGLFDKAKENYEQALKLANESGDVRASARLTGNMGVTQSALGKYDDAERQYNKALSQSREQGDATAVAMTLNNVALMERNKGRFRQTVASLVKALDVDQQDKLVRILALSNLGNTYKDWGEFSNAEKCYNEMLNIARDSKDEYGVCTALINVGRVQQAQKRYEEALKNYEEARSLYQKIKASTFRVNNLIGSVYLETGDLKKAEPFVREGGYNSGLGRLALLKADYRTALRYYDRLNRSATRYNRSCDLFTAYIGLGRSNEGLDKLKRAEGYYSKALELCEELRSQCLLTERPGFLASHVNGFLPTEAAKGLTRVRYKMGLAKDAVFPSETTRARQFADRAAQRGDIAKLGAPSAVVEKERSLCDRAASLRKARGVVPRQKDRKRFDQISAQIAATEKELGLFEEKVRNEYPKYASARWPRPVKLKDAALKPGEYAILFDLLGTGIGVQVINGRKMEYSAFKECDLGKLRDDIKTFRSCFETAQLREFDPALGANLYRKLLSEALSKIPGGAHVTIIPDGELALLPFDALVAQGEPVWRQSEWGEFPEGLTYLADLYPISYQQSLTALTLSRNATRPEREPERVLVIADPVFDSEPNKKTGSGEAAKPQVEKTHTVTLMNALESEADDSLKLKRLPGTANLARELRRIFGDKSDVFTELDATKQVFEEKVAPNMDKYRWVVFATHGFASCSTPGIMQPWLALSAPPAGGDCFLRMTDVLALNMNADLVALTACQTGLGRVLPGEGVMSLGRAFQCAGAKTALVSLWSVSEGPSVKLMEKFFHLLNKGEGRMQAWLSARRDLRDEGFSHPFYWAPFIVIGEVK